MINAIVAIGQTDWEAQFVSGLTHPTTGVQVQRRCVDALDVMAVTKVLSCDAVIISDYTLRVDQEFIAKLNRQKIRVIALTTNPLNFTNLGQVECVLIDINNPLAAISTLAALVRLNKAQPIVKDKTCGELIYVAGFGGGTGKTRLAMEVSYQLAQTNKRILLVDADTYGPALMQMFGLATNTPGILEVCRKVERKIESQKLVSDSSYPLTTNLSFIPGLVKRSRWIDIRHSALKVFWESALSEYDYVVVDAGPVLEPEPAIAIETGAVKRNLVSSSALHQSAKVLLTSRRDESSVTRLIKGYAEFQAQLSGKSISVACLGPADGRNEKEVISSIQVHADVANVQIINLDFNLIKQTEANKTFVSEQFQKSNLALEYLTIAKSLIETAKSTSTSKRLDRLLTKPHRMRVT